MSKGYSDYFSAYSRSSAIPWGRTADFASSQLVYAKTDLSKISHADRVSLFKKILSNKIHGLSFSPYMDGQSHGTEISEQQIRSRLDIIKPYIHWIRTFSCIEGNQHTPRIAHENGLKTMVGIDLTDDREMNEVEFENAIEIARAGHADILAVGNEVLLRGDMSVEELLEYIQRARQSVPDVTVGYVDAYFLFENHPDITEACDVLLINCYPFWEQCPAEYSLFYIKEMYRRALKVANGKKVIISETGWPNIGTPYDNAVPSQDNALDHFINAYQWADEEDIDIFYFSSFDESWKVDDEGDVGASWGLWDKDGKLKYV
jgi:exo-beta-1,3-glucanase (GH17 family)